MDWKRLAIAPRRRGISTALVYGLSLTVRFISPIAEEAPRQPVHSASILLDHGWPGKPVMPVALRGWPLGPRSCRAGCEGPALLSALPSCAAP